MGHDLRERFAVRSFVERAAASERMRVPLASKRSGANETTLTIDLRPMVNDSLPNPTPEPD